MIIDQRLFFEDKLFRYTCLKKKGNKLEYDLYITFFRVRRIDKSLLEIMFKILFKNNLEYLCSLVIVAQ